MKIPLVWRMVGPTLVVSMLLLTLGLGAAWYVYRWNQQVAAELDRQIAQIMAAESLVLSIRDVRLELGRYLTSDDLEMLTLAKAQAKRAGERISELRSISPLADSLTLDRLQNDYAQLLSQIQYLDRPDPATVQSIRSAITESTLAKADDILSISRQTAVATSKQNQLVAKRVGLSLAVLGLSGSVAGLLAGFTIARSVSNSIEELLGSVAQAATCLEVEEDASNGLDGLPGLVAAMSHVKDKTASVMNELELTRATATRQDQLAAVGQLAAGIAHELRNPLSAVKLLVDSAKERGESLSNGDLNVVQAEVDRIDAMLQSFLDFARPTQLKRELTNLLDTVSSAVELVRPRAARQGVSMLLEESKPTNLLIDREQIRHVMINLLNNAIDSQPHGGEIRISQRLTTEPSDRFCAISVSDKGPGVLPEIAANVFDPFVSSKETGVGLGLAICRRILESHGGTIEITSNDQSGAVFTFRLPII